MSLFPAFGNKNLIWEVILLNEKKLRARIVEVGLTNNQVASKMGINIATFYRKIKSNKFNLAEMQALKKILDLDSNLMMEIFFAK